MSQDVKFKSKEIYNTVQLQNTTLGNAVHQHNEAVELPFFNFDHMIEI
jgi:hypothetical protein